MFEPVRLLRKRLCSTCPDESSSPPPSTQEKNPQPPKTPPHQDFSSPVHCTRDRSHEQTPSTNQLCGPHRKFVPGVNNRARNHDASPHNGTELSDHPPRSGGQPDHPVRLPRPGSKRSTRRRNPQNAFIFFLSTCVCI